MRARGTWPSSPNARWSGCRAPRAIARACPSRPAGERSPGRVQPADGGAVGGAAERLKLVIPGGAEQPADFVLEGLTQPQGHAHGRPEPVLRHHDVAVGSGHRGEDTEVRRVAVPPPATPGRPVLGPLEPELVPSG